MEVAAGITGFVCAVGQACQVAAKLHAFFTNITNAPAQIQQLSDKLIALHSVLARINDVAVSLDADCGVEIPVDVKLSLNRCLRRLEVVQSVVRKLDINIMRNGTGDKWKIKRNWMKVKWAFKENEIARICVDLDSEKSDLGLALQSLNLLVDAISLKHMEGLQSSMAGLMQTSKSHTELVKNHVDDRFLSLERSLNTISGHIERANTQNMLPDEIMSMIQATVTKSVQEAMTKAMLTGTTPTFGNNFSEEPFSMSRATTYYGGEEMSRGYSGSTLVGSNEYDTWKDWEGRREEMDDAATVCVEPIDIPTTRGPTKEVGLKYRNYRRLPTSLGLFLIFYTTASSSSMAWDDPVSQLSSTFEMGFTFIPAAWLFTTAITASFRKTTRFTPSPINDMNINFKSFNVVPTTADVMLYAMLGDTLKLKELFSQRAASPNDRDKHGRTPLHWAAAKGHVDTCPLLLQNGADPNTPNEMARTPLHWTTFLSCNADVIRLLIANGCDPDIPNVGGQSSLFSTGDKNYAAVLEAILNQDHFMVDIDQADNWGRTPLMWVVGSEKDENLESTKALLKKGASATKTDKQGLTPLHLLMLSATPSLNKKESMITLLRADADPRASSEELGGLTPTDIAKYNGVLDTWRAALEACRLDLQSVMREGTRDNEQAIIATAIGKVQKAATAAEGHSMNVESALRRRKRIVELDDDENELDDVKRTKIDEIPRRVQYQLFEGDWEALNSNTRPAPPMPPSMASSLADPIMESSRTKCSLNDYQLQLLALEQQNRRRLYRARAEQDSLSHGLAPYPELSPGSTPTHMYHASTNANQASQQNTHENALSSFNITSTDPINCNSIAHNFTESNPSPSYFSTPKETTCYSSRPMETSPTPSYSSGFMETSPASRYSSGLMETSPASRYSSGFMKNSPTSSYSSGFMETSPTPSYCTTKIQRDNPPDRRDCGASYSSVATPISKASMNEPYSCHMGSGNNAPIRNQNDIFTQQMRLREIQLQEQQQVRAAQLHQMQKAQLQCQREYQNLAYRRGEKFEVSPYRTLSSEQMEEVMDYRKKLAMTMAKGPEPMSPGRMTEEEARRQASQMGNTEKATGVPEAQNNDAIRRQMMRARNANAARACALKKKMTCQQQQSPMLSYKTSQTNRSTQNHHLMQMPCQQQPTQSYQTPRIVRSMQTLQYGAGQAMGEFGAHDFNSGSMNDLLFSNSGLMYDLQAGI